MQDDKQAKKDIEAVYRYLKIYDPDHADRNYAAAFLDFIQTKIKQLAINDPEKLDELYEAFQKDKTIS